MSATTPGALDRASSAFERGVTFLLRGRTDADAAWEPVRLVLVWLLTRLVVIGIIAVAPFVANDVNYYGTVITGQADPDFPGTLREYPVPALWLLMIPAFLASGEIGAYGWWFVLLMLCVDAVFLLTLARVGGSPRAVTAWLAAGVAIGPLLLLRFDILTGAAVGIALLLAATRPRVAALLMVLAASIKLWPALLVGVVGAPSPRRRAFVVATAATSVVLVLASIATHGWDRLLTPLSYQTGRGLQVESLAAFPSMVLWALGVDGFTVDYPDSSQSFDVSGPGTAFAALLASIATLLVLGWVLWATARLWLRRGGSELLVPAAWVALSSTCLLVLTNKVFSPQYLAWLLPLTIVVLALDRGQRARTSTYLMMAGAVAAQVVYPWLYTTLIGPGPVTGSLVAVVLVGVRLALVLAVAWIATSRASALLRAG